MVGSDPTKLSHLFIKAHIDGCAGVSVTKERVRLWQYLVHPCEIISLRGRHWQRVATTREVLIWSRSEQMKIASTLADNYLPRSWRDSGCHRVYLPTPYCLINPLTAGAEYNRVFISTLCTTFWTCFEQLTSILSIWIIFTHLKLWIASARHNFKWVKIQIE